MEEIVLTDVRELIIAMRIYPSLGAFKVFRQLPSVFERIHMACLQFAGAQARE